MRYCRLPVRGVSLNLLYYASSWEGLEDSRRYYRTSGKALTPNGLRTVYSQETQIIVHHLKRSTESSYSFKYPIV